MPCITELERQRQVEFWGFEASLFYIVSSRLENAARRDPVSKISMISEYQKQLVRKVSALRNTEPSLRHIPHLPKHPSCCAPASSSHGVPLIIPRWFLYVLFICLEKMAFWSCPTGSAATDLVAIQVKSTSWHPQHKSTTNSFTKEWAWETSPWRSGQNDLEACLSGLVTAIVILSVYVWCQINDPIEHSLCARSTSWLQMTRRHWPNSQAQHVTQNPECS